MCLHPEICRVFQKLLGDGSQWGLRLSYVTQTVPGGLVQAFLLAESFLIGSPSALILGDNIFCDLPLNFPQLLADEQCGATLFAYPVSDPEHYGVVGFDECGRVCTLDEKPCVPPSHYAVTGLYFYDKYVIEKAKTIWPSARGELEITDLNRCYLEEDSLHVHVVDHTHICWLDAGTPESLLKAGQLVSGLEEQWNCKIACPEEIAFRQGWIDARDLYYLAESLAKNSYGHYLFSCLGR